MSFLREVVGKLPTSPPQGQTASSIELSKGRSSLGRAGAKLTRRNNVNAGKPKNAKSATRNAKNNLAIRPSSALSSSGARVVEPEDSTISRIKVLLKRGTTRTTADKEELNKLFNTIKISGDFDSLTKSQALTLDRLRNKPTLTAAEMAIYEGTLAVFGRPISSPFGSGTATAMLAAAPTINAKTTAFRGAFTGAKVAGLSANEFPESNSSNSRGRPRSASGARSTISSNTRANSAPPSFLPPIPTNRPSEETFNYVASTPLSTPPNINPAINTVRLSAYLNKPNIAPNLNPLPNTPIQKSNTSSASSQRTNLSSASGLTTENSGVIRIGDKSGENNQGSSSANMSESKTESKTVTAATPPLPPPIKPDLTDLAKGVISEWRVIREGSKYKDSFIAELNTLGDAIRTTKPIRASKDIPNNNDANKLLKSALEGREDGHSEYDSYVMIPIFYIDAKTAPKERAFMALINLAYLAAKKKITLTDKDITNGLKILFKDEYNKVEIDDEFSEIKTTEESTTFLLSIINNILQTLGYIKFQYSLNADLGLWTGKLIEQLDILKGLIDINTTKTNGKITSIADKKTAAGSILDLIISATKISNTPKTYYDKILTSNASDELVDTKKNLIALYIQNPFKATDIYDNPSSSSSSSTQANDAVIVAANHVSEELRALEEAILPTGKNSSVSVAPLNPAASINAAKEQLKSSISALAETVALNPTKPRIIPENLRAIIDAAYPTNRILAPEDSEIAYNTLADRATLFNQKAQVLNELINSAVYSQRDSKGLADIGTGEEAAFSESTTTTAEESAAALLGSTTTTDEANAAVLPGKTTATSGVNVAASTIIPGTSATGLTPSFDQRTLIVKNFTEMVYPALEGLESMGPMEPEAIAAITTLCGNLGATATTATTATTAATAFIAYTPDPDTIYPIEHTNTLAMYAKVPSVILPQGGLTSKNRRTPTQTARKILVRLYYLLKKLITTSNDVDETPAKITTSKYIDLTDKTTSAVSNAMNNNNPSLQKRFSTNSTFIQSLYDLVQVYNDLIMTYYNQSQTSNPTEYQNANAIIEKYILTNGNNIIMPIDKSKSPSTPPIFPQRHYVVLGLMNNVIKYATLAYESLSTSSSPNQTNITNIQSVIAYLSHEMIDLLTLGDIAKMSGGGEEEPKSKRKTLRRSKRVHKIEKDSSE